jgi:hypothetical protein
MLLIPVLVRLKQENHEFQANLAYIISSREAWVTQGHPAEEEGGGEKGGGGGGRERGRGGGEAGSKTGIEEMLRKKKRMTYNNPVQ